MPIIRPFMASRKFVSTTEELVQEQVRHLQFAVANFLDDTGVAATAFPVPTYYVIYLNGD